MKPHVLDPASERSFSEGAFGGGYTAETQIDLASHDLRLVAEGRRPDGAHVKNPTTLVESWNRHSMTQITQGEIDQGMKGIGNSARAVYTCVFLCGLVLVASTFAPEQYQMLLVGVAAVAMILVSYGAYRHIRQLQQAHKKLKQGPLKLLLKNVEELRAVLTLIYPVGYRPFDFDDRPMPSIQWMNHMNVGSLTAEVDKMVTILIGYELLGCGVYSKDQDTAGYDTVREHVNTRIRMLDRALIPFGIVLCRHVDYYEAARQAIYGSGFPKKL